MLYLNKYGRVVATVAVLVALFLVGQSNPRPVEAQSGNAVRTVVVPAAQAVTLQRLPVPPTRSPAELAQLQAAGAKTHVRGRATASDLAPAKPRVATALAPTVPQPLPSGSSPSTFAVFQNSDLHAATSGSTSVVAEPSVGNIGPYVFETGNWYAALSSDGGSTFSYVDPYSQIAPPLGQRFCCDQSTLYSPSRNLYFWLLLYLNSAGGTGPGTLRLAVANGPSGLASLNFHYFDFNPQAQGLGFPAGDWYDYPYMALSSNYLYISANVFKQDAVTFDGTVILRLPLDALAGTASFAYNAYVITDRDPKGALLFNATLTHGATGTMYWATHYSNSRMRVYAWPETGAVFSADIAHTAYPTTTTYQCQGPDGRDWCGRLDDRVLTGWVSNGILGFMWNAPQGSAPGGFGSFNYPYMQSILVNQSSFALLGEPLMFNSGYAFTYAGAGVNARGHVAGTVFYGGGALYPTLAAFIWDNLSPTAYPAIPANFETYTIAASTAGPNANQWGDFLVARENDASNYTRNNWIGTGYTLVGGSTDNNVHPLYLVFGRQRDNPLPVYPVPLVALHLEGAAGNPTVQLTLTNATSSPIVNWNATAPSGVTLTPPSGAFSPTAVIWVTVSAAGKATGTYSMGSISISATDNVGNSITGAPLQVPVTLIVNSKFMFLPFIGR